MDVPIINTEEQLVALKVEFNRRWARAFEQSDAKVALLREALTKFGQHAYTCATLGTAKDPMHAFPIINPGPCDCGLDEILEVTKR